MKTTLTILMAAAVLVATGCPDSSRTTPTADDKTVPTPSPTKSQPPPKKTNQKTKTEPPPKPTAHQAWETAARRHSGWSRQVARLMKLKREREALERNLLEPEPELLTLATLTRSLMVWDGKRVTSIRAVLRGYLKKNPQLNPTVFNETSLHTTALLVLQDASFLYGLNLVRDQEGRWWSLRRGLPLGKVDEDLATRLLTAVDQTRQGRWSEATRTFSQVFRALARQNSKHQGAKSLEAWEAVARAYSRTKRELEDALGNWRRTFIVKNKSG